MIANPHLSIVIPTFNRAELLDYCLGIHIPLALVYGIEIFIFDNASTDDTEKIVKNKIALYPLIRYYKHKSNIGPDSNFEFALKFPKTDYVWLLGDSYLIPKNGIEFIIRTICINSIKFDMFLLNIENIITDVPSNDYSDSNLLLRDLFWLTNCMSCLVYHKTLIENANFVRYRNTNFLQTGIIYEYISNREFYIKWIPYISLILWKDFNGIKKISWQTDVLEIWFNRRSNLILSLPPSYSLDIKLKLIQEIHNHTKTSITDLLTYRANDVYNYEKYQKFKGILKLCTNLPFILLLIISIIPKQPLKLMQAWRQNLSQLI